MDCFRELRPLGRRPAHRIAHILENLPPSRLVAWNSGNDRTFSGHNRYLRIINRCDGLECKHCLALIRLFFVSVSVSFSTLLMLQTCDDSPTYGPSHGGSSVTGGSRQILGHPFHTAPNSSFNGKWRHVSKYTHPASQFIFIYRPWIPILPDLSGEHSEKPTCEGVCCAYSAILSNCDICGSSSQISSDFTRSRVGIPCFAKGHSCD